MKLLDKKQQYNKEIEHHYCTTIGAQVFVMVEDNQTLDNVKFSR